MALKQSPFLQRLLIQFNPLSQRFNPENLRGVTVPKPLTLPTLEEWVTDIEVWQDPPPQEEFNDDV